MTSPSFPAYLQKQAYLHRLERARQAQNSRLTPDAYAVDEAVDRDPVRWIAENFFIPETGRAIDLYPSQAIPLAEALRRDADGNFIYSTVLWSAIKKSAKSSIAAAVGMWFAWRKPLSSVKVLGNDLDQAASRVYEYMRRAVMLRPDWRDSIIVNNYTMKFPNGSVIKAIPVDPQGEAGGNDDCLLYTELWGWKSRKHQLMWSESTLSPTKYGKSLRFCESYAGYKGSSPVLEHLYANAVENGRVIDAEYEMYANDKARLFALWNTHPTLPWQTPEYYLQEAGALTPTEFDRLHRNQWGTSTEAFVPEEWWTGCQRALEAMRPRQPVVLALDAGVTSDCFGIVGVSRVKDVLSIRYARKYTPPPGGKLDFAEAEAELERLCRLHNVVSVVYDPYQLHDLMTRFKRKHIAAVNDFDQGTRRLIADKHLYDLIRDQLVHWDERLPNMGDLTEHVTHADRVAANEKLRLVKRSDDQKIDLAVCLSMACHEIKRLNVS